MSDFKMDFDGGCITLILGNPPLFHPQVRWMHTVTFWSG